MPPVAANRRSAETGRQRTFIVMAGAGRSSTPCGADISKGVSGGPEPVPGLAPGSRHDDQDGRPAHLNLSAVRRSSAPPYVATVSGNTEAKAVFEAAKHWFALPRNQKIIQTQARATLRWMLENRERYTGEGTRVSGGFISSHTPTDDPFVERERQENLYVLAHSNGLNRLMNSLTEKGVVDLDTFDSHHKTLFSEPMMPACRELERRRRDPKHADWTSMSDIAKRFYASPEDRYKVRDRKIAPIVALGVISVDSPDSNGYRVMSGPVFSAFVEHALKLFIAEKRI